MFTATCNSHISTNGGVKNYKIYDETMGDEKSKENQRQQTSTAYTNWISETLHAELPPKKVNIHVRLED
jgi:hypothetical protein